MKNRLNPAVPLLVAALFVIAGLLGVGRFEPRAGAQSSADVQRVVAVASGPKLPSAACSPTAGKVYFNLTVAASGRATGLYRCSAGAWVGPAAFANVYTGSASLNFGATAAGTCDSLTVTVTGAASGDSVSLGIPSALAAADAYQSFQAYVSATNTVTVKRCNLTNATTALSDPAAATVKVIVTHT